MSKEKKARNFIFSIMSQDGSLKTISAVIAEKLKSMGTMNASDLTSMMISGIQGPSQQTSMKRRVYDVIGVLAAADIINKNGTNITWVGYSNNIKSQQDQINYVTKNLVIKDKIERLKYKMRILAYINALIVRNRNIPRPISTLGLPFIVFDSDISATQEENQLVIKFLKNDAKDRIYTQMNVIDRIDFKFDINSMLVKCFPALKPITDFIDSCDEESETEGM